MSSGGFATISFPFLQRVRFGASRMKSALSVSGSASRRDRGERAFRIARDKDQQRFCGRVNGITTLCIHSPHKNRLLAAITVVTRPRKSASAHVTTANGTFATCHTSAVSQFQGVERSEKVKDILHANCKPEGFGRVCAAFVRLAAPIRRAASAGTGMD